MSLNLKRRHEQERKTISELVIKTAKENGDMPEDFGGKETKLEPITLGKFKIELKDVFNPTVLRKWFEKINGHTNKDKEKD